MNVINVVQCITPEIEPLSQLLLLIDRLVLQSMEYTPSNTSEAYANKCTQNKVYTDHFQGKYLFIYCVIFYAYCY